MAYAITQTCCNDASCVSVCPVNCIHPTPDERDFGSTEMLYIDPQTCIDCGACADVCPVDAIRPVDRLSGPDTIFADINAQYYEERQADTAWSRPQFPKLPAQEVGRLRVAVVGTGPAAGYTAQSLLQSTDAEVTMIDRLPVPGGLIRYGVAPDHPSTKRIGDSFAGLYAHPRLRAHLNVEVGTDITHAEIAAHHHAVVYAVGAASDKSLGIPGEEMAGSISATQFVNWYNAHPEVPASAVDLAAERAVVVGNGNVALDVARILLSDPDDLASTDIADHAVEALRASRVREVVLLARRGPEHAAFSRPEFHGLQRVPGVRLVVDDHAGVRDAIAGAAAGSKAALLQALDIVDVDWTVAPPPGRRIVFRFLASPAEIVGDGRVESLRVRPTRQADRDAPATVRGDQGELIRTRLVLRSIGYRSTPVPDLPFDTASATVPNAAGRVVVPNTGEHLPGTYVAGWVKRGPSGGIGANRTCAAETVDALIEDAARQRLPRPPRTRRQFARLVRRRKPTAVGRRGMRAIDRSERARGAELGRPRVKHATVPDLLAAGQRRPG
jgi:ferredoxin/flavodoxin---NADP+ reductase